MKRKRSLAAIMFTDIVGYSKLISQDEERAVNFLVDNKNSQKQIIENSEGKLWKDLGDGIMATFDTIRDAVQCAEQIIAKTTKDNRLNLRIGIHLSDITEREGDIYGEGINIASRIMEKAGANRIYISEAAYLTLCNRNKHKVEFKGRKRLKNIPEAVGIYDLITSQVGKNGYNHKNEYLVNYLEKPSVIRLAPAVIIGIVLPAIIQLSIQIPILGPLI